jgi:DNA polymerase-3 subunit gamma/tau
MASGSYEVVARRFRPKTFDEIVGQDAILTSLRSALAKDRVPHAFLFAGSRGVGKTTLARIFARALNCEQGPTPEPCGACAPCASILDGSNADVVEIDAASHNLVDDIRELRERVGFVSMGSRYKVYILDEAHMLTRSAFNAFLKTLEEPPPRVVFVLATTEAHKLPETIRSRCQVLTFRRVGQRDIEQRLARICAQENVAVPADVLTAIALASRGGMRDAETALERVLLLAAEADGAFDLDAYHRLVHRVGIDRVVEVTERLAAGDAAAALRFAAQAIEEGADEREVLGDLLDVLRAVLVLRLDGAQTDLFALGDSLRPRLAALAEACDTTRLDAMIQAGLIGRERLRQLEDRRLVLEVTLLRIARAGELPVLGELLAAVRAGRAPAAEPRGAAPAAAAPAAVTEGPLRQRLLARLAKIKPLLMHTVEQVELEGPDADGVVRVRYVGEGRMHRDRLASPDVQKLLAEQLGELCGRRVSVALAAPPAPAPAPTGETPAARPQRSPGVRKLVDRFDGRLLEPEEPPQTP